MFSYLQAFVRSLLTECYIVVIETKDPSHITLH